MDNLNELQESWDARLRETYPLAAAHGARARQPLGRFYGSVRLKLTFDATKEFSRFVRHIERVVASPQALLPLLRQAAAETVLANVRQRFIYGLPNALEMEGRYIADPGSDSTLDDRRRNEYTSLSAGGVASRDRNTREMAALTRLYQRLSRAQKRGNPKTLQRIYEGMARHKIRMVRSLNRHRVTKRQIQPHRLSSGRFRPMALRVLELMTDAGLLNAAYTPERGGTLRVGIGNMPLLNRVRTPSATEFVLKPSRKTSSPYDILWRHLEFGTGAYSRDPFGQNHPQTKYSAYGGGWWYSPNPPGGLYLHGSRGVHALREAKSGEQYEADNEAFAAAADVVISNWLLRKRR